MEVVLKVTQRKMQADLVENVNPKITIDLIAIAPEKKTLPKNDTTIVAVALRIVEKIRQRSIK